MPRPSFCVALVRHLWHLCGWIERIPGGTRLNDGLETGIMGGGCGRDISVGNKEGTDLHGVAAPKHAHIQAA